MSGSFEHSDLLWSPVGPTRMALKDRRAAHSAVWARSRALAPQGVRVKQQPSERTDPARAGGRLMRGQIVRRCLERMLIRIALRGAGRSELAYVQGTFGRS